MTTTMVFTFVGADKPGLVGKLAQTVSSHGGNWLESRMSELAGHFAGIVQVGVSQADLPALRAALAALSSDQLTIIVAGAGPHGGTLEPDHLLRLTIIGNDRPGIVREVATALAARNINVHDMVTTITSAPMSGAPWFEATVSVEVPVALDLAELKAQLDTIANALSLDIDMD
jgi:glycine cleavage system regulatory protein